MRKPKQINSISLERICRHYDDIRTRAAEINNLNARSGEDMVHDAIMLSAADEAVIDMSDDDLADYVLWRMNTIIFEAKKKQSLYCNANDLQTKKENYKVND